MYKLCNNAVFGKMCEDLRKRIDVRIVTNQPQAERYVAQCNFDSFKILNDDATMIKMKKMMIRWTKTTYIGFTILELSKLHMYKFHYEHMVPLYTHHNKCNIYDDMRKTSSHYDSPFIHYSLNPQLFPFSLINSRLGQLAPHNQP